MPRTARVTLILILSLALLVSAAPRPVAAQQATPGNATAPLDLAAMTLIPSDLDQPGFGLGGSAMLTIEEEAATVAARVGMLDAELIDRLREIGWERRYVSSLHLTEDPTVAGADNRLVISTTVTEYTTAEGAAAGFALLEDELEEPAARDVPGTVTFGDQSEITRLSDRTADRDEPYERLNLTFQLGNLIGDVIIDDLTNQEPEIALAEDLAAKLQNRIEMASTNGGPGLGNLVLRLEGDEVPSSRNDSYVRLNGETLPLLGESADGLAGRDESYGAASDVYDLQHLLDVAGAEASPFYQVVLRRYPTEADASAAITATANLVSSGPYVDVAVVPNAATFGDESVTAAYGFEIDSTLTARGHRIAARTGTLFARIDVDGLPEVPLAVVEDLMAAQLACLESPDTACQPLTVPVDALTGQEVAPVIQPTATPAEPTPPQSMMLTPTPTAPAEPAEEAAVDPTAPATETPEEPAVEPTPRDLRIGDLTPTPTPAGAGVVGSTYTSPYFGYSISWDESRWTVDDESSQPGYDFLLLRTPFSSLYLEAYEDGEGDPASCLSESVASLRDEAGVSDFELARGPDGRPLVGSDGDSAFAVYTLTFTGTTGESVEFANFLECHTLVPDESVLAITHITTAEFYDEEAVLVQDLLASLSLTGEEPAAMPAPTDEMAGVDGNTYQSPAYGYRLSWDASWEVQGAASGDNDDLLLLTNGTSEVSIQGYAFASDSFACVAEAAGRVAQEPGHDNFSPAEDQTGARLQGGDATRAYAVYIYTVTDDEGTTADIVVYLECRTVVTDEAVVLFTQTVPIDAYDDEIPARRQLLDELSI